MEAYAVIICDIIKSRKIADRDEVQKQVESGFAEINARYSDLIAVPFQFTLGDEFQGVLSDYTRAPDIVGRLREEIAPVKLRIATGIGEIATSLSPDIRRVDGSAFHAARDAMEVLQSDSRREGLKMRHRLTALRGESGNDDIVDTVYTLYDVLVSKRTEKQWWAARVYNLTGSFAQASEMYGTNIQNISKLAKSGHLAESNQAEKFLERYLEGKHKSLFLER